MDEDIKTPDMSTLEGWFSAPRMARYADARDPSALYVWDARLSKALLEDISHVEVLLRNFMADRLAADCERATGDRNWFDHPGRCDPALLAIYVQLLVVAYVLGYQQWVRLEIAAAKKPKCRESSFGHGAVKKGLEGALEFSLRGIGGCQHIKSLGGSLLIDKVMNLSQSLDERVP